MGKSNLSKRSAPSRTQCKGLWRCRTLYFRASKIMPHAEPQDSEFTISIDPALLDFSAVCGFLEQTYWGKSRSRDLMRKAFENSLCFGVYRGREQVGFARAITDYATYVYLADVYIVEA